MKTIDDKIIDVITTINVGNMQESVNKLQELLHEAGIDTQVTAGLTPNREIQLNFSDEAQEYISKLLEERGLLYTGE